jgi:uncharacterized membrane protein YfcA
MVYLICGAIVGIVMGLTGSGGALISIPLFMQFLGMPLREASVLSLFVVMIGSFSNFFNFVSKTHYKLGLIIIFASAAGSYLSIPFKKLLPDQAIMILLSLVSFFALYSVWKPSKTQESFLKKPHILISIFVGLILGVLTTFTGIGGGVLVIPVLLGLYGFSQDEALGTSLFVVGLSSFSSFVIQNFSGAKIALDLGLGYLVIGTIVAAYLLKWVSKSWNIHFLALVRKMTFTLVVVFALVKIYFF